MNETVTPMLTRCIAVDFSEPDPMIVLQLVLLIAHVALVFYRYRKQIKDIAGIESRLDKLNVPK
jgi:hypothetical protein